MNRFDIHTTILSNENVAEDHYLLRCECPDIAKHVQPGQFIHVLILNGTGSNGAGLLLRRPFTVYSVDSHEITMLYQVIGEGTLRLSEMGKGSPIHILGPLGNTFEIKKSTTTAILVGGGAGIASLMLLAAALRNENRETHALVGAQHRRRLLSIDDLKVIGVSVHIATDDGSIGHHGFVTDILSNMLTNSRIKNPAIYACGPHGMLAAVNKITTSHDVPTQVAMENRMGCALGVCLGCVCPIRVDEDQIEYQRVCTEGPVFNPTDIAWDI